MKTRLLFIIASLVCLGLNAQDVVLGDFEDGIGDWSTWGAPLSVVANPYKTGNTSDSVALFDQSSTTWSGLTIWMDNGIMTTAGDYKTVSIDIYTETAGTVGLQMDNPTEETSSADSIFESSFLSFEANTWTTLEFDISSASYVYKQLAFKTGTQDELYYDNITLVAAEVVEEDTVLIEDFEDGISSWQTWQTGDSIYCATNLNSSDSTAVLEQTATNAAALSGALAIWNGSSYLIDATADYKYILVDVYLDVAGTVQLYLGNSASSAENVTVQVTDIPAETWTTIAFDISDYVSSYDFQQYAFQTTAETAYFDDIRIAKTISSGGDTPDAIKETDATISIATTASGIEVIADDMISVAVYGITGKLVTETSEATVALGSGFYIVVVTTEKGTETFKVVK